jgi:hypothetical protein
MSRPKPRVLLEHLDPNTLQLDQILEADAIWAVVYKDDPFNLKTSSNQSDSKYKKSSFSNPGHAHNLAARLNTMFKCSDFAVIKLTKGVIVR